MELISQITEDLKVKLEKLYARHERVDIAIESILQGQQGGNIKLWVDQMANPRISKIEHGSFIRFAGEPDKNAEITAIIQALKTPFFLQPSPAGWIHLLEKEFDSGIKTTTRYTFSSTQLSKSHLEAIIRESPWKEAVQRLSKQQARKLSENEWGKYHFMNYSQPEDLVEKGLGYCIEIGGEIVSCCSSALVSRTGYEVNMITKPAYRHQGMATTVAAKFIIECLEKNREPHWDAANESSKRLAIQLGYTGKGEYVLHYVL